MTTNLTSITRRSLLLLATLLPVMARADVWQDPNTKVNYEYDPAGTTASVKASSNPNSDTPPAGSPEVEGSIAILPSITVNGKSYTVTKIGFGAFSLCAKLTAIDIPNTVTAIEYCAFKGCKGLTSINIPESVTWIGVEAFWPDYHQRSR